LLKKLLESKPARRLGNGPEGTKEIKDHPFFLEIDWIKLYNKELKPPFIPEIQNEEDISQIDQLFTNELPQETPVVSKLGENQKVVNHYGGFTFERTDIMSKMAGSGHFGGKKK